MAACKVCISAIDEANRKLNRKKNCQYWCNQHHYLEHYVLLNYKYDFLYGLSWKPHYIKVVYGQYTVHSNSNHALKILDWTHNFLIQDETGDAVWFLLGRLGWWIGWVHIKDVRTAKPHILHSILKLVSFECLGHSLKLTLCYLMSFIFSLILLLFVSFLANPSKRFSNMFQNSSCYLVWEWCNEAIDVLSHSKCTTALFIFAYMSFIMIIVQWMCRQNL